MMHQPHPPHPTARHLTTLLAACVLGAIQPAAAEEFHARSAPHRAALLELYTSEGCSSCPPADQWFSGLNLPTDRLVRVAFHVDYWDYLGWPDPYASAAHSSRQRELALRGYSRTVYTPQLIIGGNVTRARDGFEKQVKEINQKPPGANLELRASYLAPGKIAFDLLSQAISPHTRDCCEVYAALTETGLVNAVKAGENGGRTLRHEHVVRKLAGPYPLDKPVSDTIAAPADSRPEHLALVAFVQNPRSGEVLQALHLPLHR